MMSDQVEKLVKPTESSLLPPEVEPIPIFSERDGEANFVDSKSSSTEGPDSSPRSNTSSPLAEVMIPAYPDPTELILDDDEAEDQGKPLLPFFSLKFLDEVSKDGDIVRFKIRVKKLTAPLDDMESDVALVIEREYEDFEFLHHVLTTHNQIVGLIVPPLPHQSGADPHSAESRTKKQFGSSARAMLGDDFKVDAKGLERFLQQMLCHPVFGRDKHLEEFLINKHPPIRAKIKKGFLAGMKESLDIRKTSGVRDSDDFFQKEREWAFAYGKNIRNACESFNSLMYAQLRFANQVTHLATNLNASVGGHDGSNAFYNRINSRFSTCLEATERKSIEAKVESEASSIGDYMTQWSAFVDAETAMLHRRTGLFVEVENATKALSKAKPAKAHALRKVKEDKEILLEQVSRTAELETRRFHHQRLAELKLTMIKYAEGQLRVAQDSYKALAESTLKMRDFPLPSVTSKSLSKPE